MRSVKQLLAGLLLFAGLASAQTGSISGTVYDKEFEEPLANAKVTVLELDVTVETNDRGGYVLVELKPGKYSVSFSKEGSIEQVQFDVVVASGDVTELDVWLAGEFTEMEEYVVQKELDLAPGSEAALLNLRFESPALLNTIGSDLMKQAGAGDAAEALKFAAGASVKDGKSAVIRGLPDRYVSSQVNFVRLPTADEDKRAVELDQFPSAVVESILIAKTFTPNEQGDASGGAVNVLLKGIPEKPFFVKFNAQSSFNSQVATSGDSFLSYDGGGVTFFGFDDGRRDEQPTMADWEGAVGPVGREAPLDHKWALAFGGNEDLTDDVRIGGVVNFFYERDSSFYDNGKDDRYWVENAGEPLRPQQNQGTFQDEDFKSALFNITRAQQTVQWGGLAAFGLESENHSISFVYLYTRTTTDTSILAEDTRGKQFFFPGHDPDDPDSPGHGPNGNLQPAAPYLRLETLDYVERDTDTFQVRGEHKIPAEDLFQIGDAFSFDGPEIDWTVAFSSASLSQPDKRQFGTQWFPERVIGGGVLVLPAVHRQFRPAVSVNLGNLQRIYKTIEEDSEQFQFNVKLPFKQWDDLQGNLRMGVFHDQVTRTFDQNTFSNAGDNQSTFEADFDVPWSTVWPTEAGVHTIVESDFDIDYEGELAITAYYVMMELPVHEDITLRGGVRFESTSISTVNDAEPLARWVPPGQSLEFELDPPDIADASINQFDVLPAISLEYRPIDGIVMRAAYTETIARQTFKEITPILQQEFLGGPIFIGNPELGLSAVKNYDLRIDWTPYEGAFVSASYFFKDITDPIEYVQRVGDFNFTTARNYPSGQISGFEFEIRTPLGYFFKDLEGLTVGGNVTLIESSVQLPDDEIADLADLGEFLTERDMVNAPEYLYNLFVTYDKPDWGSKFSLFYSVTGDQLTDGAGEADGNFVPSIYAKRVGTLNFTYTQAIGDHIELRFQAKNLTNPNIQTVYRREGGIEADVTRTTFTRGIELSLSLSAEFTF